jgi:hypothetical protein
MGTPDINLKASLIALLDGIKRSDGPIVTQEMERLDQIVLTERAGLHPQLAHFLERRSYAKALAYLEADSAA